MKKALLYLTVMIFAVGCAEQPPEIDIWQAAGEGNIAAIQQHVKAGTDINALEPTGGSTPLIVAALFGQPDAAEVLILKGAALDQKNNNGSTALHLAALFCHPNIVKLLLENGAEPNPKDNIGTTPLDAVGAEWSQELEDVYAMVGGILQMEIDLDRIKRTRGSVADILKEHGAKFGNE
ncbi:MAG: ankyrin repeat domain-containing protein [Candidatus Hinthialibacter antarcticus]|nr:ankyrin repeat domain-containing protein [Candidatus Hinthialibacter antarcticus]